MTRNDGSKHFEGTLRIPVAGGLRVTVPNASVDMTFDASGDLDTISGTVGNPEIPAVGLFNSLGPLECLAPDSTTGQYLSIGYDTPSAFDYDSADYLGLPLNPSTKYFYFLLHTGQSAEWGPITLSSPDEGSTLIALAPNEPTIYGYSDHISNGVVSGGALGISGGNAITFQPTYTRDVEPHMVGFDGDLYLGASMAIPTPILAVSFTVDGGMTVNG